MIASLLGDCEFRIMMIAQLSGGQEFIMLFCDEALAAVQKDALAGFICLRGNTC